MAILNNSNAISSGGYDVNNSLRFRSSASAYLKRTPSASGNQQTWTWSGWVKRGALGSSQQIFASDNSSTSQARLNFTTSDTLSFLSYIGAFQIQLVTTQVFRDPSAWYHIVLVLDTTNATASNRTKIYVNGTQVTAFGTATYSAQNYNGVVNNNFPYYLGTYFNASSGEFFDGYMAEVNFIDGQALTPSSFGETDTTTGVWKPKAYTGTYGTNGFYLKFSDIATTSGSNAGLGKDFSGNTNYWTTNNISVTSGTTYDAMKDVPTLTSATVGNYCVWNPLNSGATLSEGNLTATTSAWTDASGSMAMPSGKWYAEFTYNSSTSTNALVGITLASFNGTGQSDTFRVAYQTIGTISRDGVASPADLTGYPTYTLGDIIGIALDVSAGTITFYKNNSSVYTLTTSVISSNEWRFFVRMNTRSFIANFGQRPFTYTPPTGFVALNTYNLPTPTILQGNKYMDATLYTGNGTVSGVSQTITNASAFKPDFVWVKSRSNAYQNALQDSVRGAGKTLFSALTNAEAGNSGDLITSFNSNGFTVNTTYLGSFNETTNNSGSTYVGWQWQAGQGSTSSNTSGTITSTVSVNTIAGFSVVTYTGTGANATVGHGLGVAPKWIVVKGRGNADNWPVYQASANASPATGHLLLNTTAAFTSTSSTWNNTAPTSTVFTVGTDTRINQNTIQYVAYCWAEIAGYSKFGSYTGNGSTDGTFVYTGFRPKYVLLKSTGVENWFVFDSSRNTYNVTTARLYPALSNAEDTNLNTLDLLSNGFKFRDTNAAWNSSGTTYIYMAFAESPFKSSLAR